MKDDLKKIIKGDVSDSKSDIDSHSRDASLFEVRPELVVYPKDSSDVSTIVRYVAEEKKTNPSISITPRAAGTCMAGGSLNNSISLDFMKYMNHIKRIDMITPYDISPHFFGSMNPVKISGTAQVEPGVYYRDFEPKTLEKNLLLPCFTASKSINSLGGMVGNNSGGELSLTFGKTEDYIKELEIVFADGTLEKISEITREEAVTRSLRGDFVGQIYKKIIHLIDENRQFIDSKKPHVGKNSAGYNIWNVIRTDLKTGRETVDLNQLIVGSQGTLGVVTEATLRLVKTQNKSAMLVVYLSKIDNLAEIINEALEVKPQTVEAYDDKTIMLAVKFWRGFLKMKGFLGALKMGLSFLPEFTMMISGIPKLVLLIECTGDDADEVLSRVSLLQNRLKKYSSLKTKIIKNKQDGEKFWMIRHDSFNLLREHVKGKRTAPFVDDVIVPPKKLPEFIPAIRKILDEYNLSYNIHGHAGNGNFHIIPLIDPDAKKSESMILEVSEKVYALVLSCGGSITAEHNDGIIRTPFLPDMYGEEMMKIFEQIKKIFDPQNIFNPGKKIGLTKKDIGRFLIGDKN